MTPYERDWWITTVQEEVKDRHADMMKREAEFRAALARSRSR